MRGSVLDKFEVNSKCQLLNISLGQLHIITIFAAEKRELNVFDFGVKKSYNMNHLPRDSMYIWHVYILQV